MIILTLGNGQQPQAPLSSWQHVEPSEHENSPPGQTMSFTRSLAAIFSIQGILFRPGWQVPCATSQVYPFGQQWIWSLQQTAWKQFNIVWQNGWENPKLLGWSYCIENQIRQISYSFLLIKCDYVVTTNLWHWTTGPSSTFHLATCGIIWTRWRPSWARYILYHFLHYRLGFCFSEPGEEHESHGTSGCSWVTLVSMRTAVSVITAACSLRYDTKWNNEKYQWHFSDVLLEKS